MVDMEFRFSKKAQLRIQVLGNQRFPILVSSKKAQLRIQEMSFMLIAVGLFFVLVGLFALSFLNSSLQGEARDIQEAEVLASVINLANSPEFSCVGQRSGCVDMYKVIGLIDSDSYKDYWEFSSLSVLRYDGFGEGSGELVECSGLGLEDCNVFNVFDKGIENEEKISTFIGLCYIEYENFYPYEKCEVGKLIVGREIK